MVTVFGHGFVAGGTEPPIPHCALRCTKIKKKVYICLLCKDTMEEEEDVKYVCVYAKAVYAILLKGVCITSI